MEDEFEFLLSQLSADESLYDRREEAIRQGVVLPILANLGWSPYNISEVIPEFQVGNGRVDYCLRIKDKKYVFIEVKRLSEDLEPHERQLLEYSFTEGIEIAILTNGLLWWFYLPLAGGTWQQRKFFTIDIKQLQPDIAAKHFVDFLSKLAITDGSALANAKDVHASRERENRIKQTLPKAWDQLLKEPDSNLLDLLADKVESMCGYQPDQQIVRKFLISIYRETDIKASTPTKTVDVYLPLTSPRKVPRRKSIRAKAGHSNKQSGVVVTLAGEKFEGQVKELCQFVLNYLVDSGAINKLQSDIPYRTSSKRYLIAKTPFHPNSNPFVRPVEYKGYYMETHKAYATTIRQFEQLLSRLNIPFEIKEQIFE